jgi:tetratricopeptide (TPR) repeat protein
MRLRFATSACTVAALGLGTLLAWADAPKGKEILHDPENRKGISAYMETVNKGEASFVGRDLPGAVAAFQDAIRMKPDEMLAFYRLGEAEQDAGKLEDAEKAWEAALSKKCTQGCDTHNTQDNLRAKVLFVLAGVRERQGRWIPAKEAWQAYNAFLQGNSKVLGFPATAADRIKVIDRRMQLEVDYGKVKERIAARVLEKEKEAADNAKKDRLNK